MFATVDTSSRQKLRFYMSAGEVTWLGTSVTTCSWISRGTRVIRYWLIQPQCDRSWLKQFPHLVLHARNHRYIVKAKLRFFISAAEAHASCTSSCNQLQCVRCTDAAFYHYNIRSNSTFAENFISCDFENNVCPSTCTVVRARLLREQRNPEHEFLRVISNQRRYCSFIAHVTKSPS